MIIATHFSKTDSTYRIELHQTSANIFQVKRLRKSDYNINGKCGDRWAVIDIYTFDKPTDSIMNAENFFNQIKN